MDQPGPGSETGHKIRQGKIARLEGRLETDSAPGKGALISIRFPLAAGKTAETVATHLLNDLNRPVAE
jgi:hypothetical protein